jgi:hypothetical protein
VARVPLGHGHDEAQVGLEQVRLGGLPVDGQRLVVALARGGEALLLLDQAVGVQTGLDALGQLDLLLGGQQGGLADGVEVDAHEVGRHQAAGVGLAPARAHLEGVVGGSLEQGHSESSSLPSGQMRPPGRAGRQSAAFCGTHVRVVPVGSPGPTRCRVRCVRCDDVLHNGADPPLCSAATRFTGNPQEWVVEGSGAPYPDRVNLRPRTATGSVPFPPARAGLRPPAAGSSARR